MNKLKYLGYSVVMQEVPNEVSLAINISGCPHRCEGCHSQYLWEDDGDVLLDNLDRLLEQYGDLVTCVCFMGGDQNMEELILACKIVHKARLKTCVYSGLDDKAVFDVHLDAIDYLKIGRYIERLGGLASKTTNQKFFDIRNNKEIMFFGD